MKISKTLATALAAATVTILSAAVVQASTPCETRCTENATSAYNSVIASQYPPQPGNEACASVAEPYKSQCIAAVDAQRAAALVSAQNAYNQAYANCSQSCVNR